MTPRKGYNHRAYRDGYDAIFPVRRTSDEWCDIHQVFVLTANGWNGLDWDERITEAEFNSRLLVSIIMHRTPDKAAQ